VRTFLLDRDPRRPAPAAGASVQLSDEETHHLVQVMRAGSGASLHLTDGLGFLYEAAYEGREGGRARVRLTAVREDPEERDAPLLGLACGVVKGKRFEWVLEKAVELGAHRIWPLRTRRGVVEPGLGRQERWQGLLRAALKQSGRSLLPRLEPAAELADLLPGPAGSAVLYGDCAGPDGEPPATPAATWLAAEVARIIPGAAPPPWLIWTVGPEGGWEEPESRRLAAAGRPLSLGPHRLRTETAAVAGLALLQQLRAAWRAGSPS
jgi:16S rRNA (uracil1498-N3)-methyltransferase